MAEIGSMAGIASSRIDIEELKRKNAEQSATRTTERNNDNRVAEGSKTDFSIAGYFGGVSTEAAAQQRRDAEKEALANKRDFSGKTTEDPKEMTGATQMAELNKQRLQYNFYNLESPDSIKRKQEEKAAAIA